jgi:hypothetical protein
MDGLVAERIVILNEKTMSDIEQVIPGKSLTLTKHVPVSFSQMGDMQKDRSKLVVCNRTLDKWDSRVIAENEYVTKISVVELPVATRYLHRGGVR